MSDDTSPTSNTGGATGNAGLGFTGRRRNRKTRRSVRIADTVAKYGITVGGLFVIAALAALVGFLFSVVLPLFQSPGVEQRLATELTDRGDIVAVGVDEELKSIWTLSEAGELSTYRAAGGEKVAGVELSDVAVTAVSESRGDVGIGREDGTVVVGTIGAGDPEFRRELTGGLEALRPGETMVLEGGIADVTEDGLVRITRVEQNLSDPIPLGEAPRSPVTHIDYLREGDRLQALVARRADGNLYFARITSQLNMMTGQRKLSLQTSPLPASDAVPENEDVVAVMIGRSGSDAYVLYANGFITWYSTKELTAGRGEASIVEERNVLSDPGRTVTAATMLTGDFTIIVGDSSGGVSGWFPAPDPDTGDWRLVEAHRLSPQDNAITSLSISGRDRQFISGDAGGNLWLRHMTSRVTQAKLQMPGGEPALTTSIAPRSDAVTAVGPGGSLTMWDVDNPHPDGNLSAMFRPTHYEGYAEPAYVWQSSAATDTAEPKLSLVPLIWGTFKATLYAMMFAVPVAILAAIYSSEFMQPKVRSVVKPSIEMMAGLPSVVLGYIAASLLAPYAEDVLPGLLITFAAVPVGVMIFGFLWQLVPPSEVEKQGLRWAGLGYLLVGLAGLTYLGLPGPVLLIGYATIGVLGFAIVLARREHLSPYMPFLIMGELIISAVCIGLFLGPWFERVLFGGDLRGWLRGQPDGWVGSIASEDGSLSILPDSFTAIPGWVLLLTPVLIVLSVIVFNLYLRHRLPMFDGRDRSRTQLAVADLVRFAVTGILAVGLAAGIGAMLSLVGLDLRHEFGLFTSGPLDRFDQRNALVVGMIMGFAVIPIIYTVSEDALTAVPNTLRSAALGAGATPWQTAIRVVLPVAISGIFSACMIGLGRAVGETMIVLMAAGNSATLHLNIFDGMRTLSANIATEMPEAEQYGTLYRVLFFSGLVLFGMTFIVNTAAEFVRARFRKRAFNL